MTTARAAQRATALLFAVATLLLAVPAPAHACNPIGYAGGTAAPSPPPAEKAKKPTTGGGQDCGQAAATAATAAAAATAGGVTVAAFLQGAAQGRAAGGRLPPAQLNAAADAALPKPWASPAAPRPAPSVGNPAIPHPVDEGDTALPAPAPRTPEAPAPSDTPTSPPGDGSAATPNPSGASDTPQHAPSVTNPVEPSALGDLFHAGVHDPQGLLMPKERAVADLLASEGFHVTARPADGTVLHKKNPDLLVRSNATDPGVLVELKSLDSPTSTAVKANIMSAGKQLEPDGGQAVIDGRAAGLTRETAEQGLARALGQARHHGSAFPTSIRIILGDGTSVTWP